MNPIQSGIMLNWYVSLTLLYLVTGSHVSQDFCLGDTASLKCPDSHIIKVSSARYGRMKETSNCITKTYTTGCQDDVTDLVNARCWGRKNCSFDVTIFVNRKPCPELNSYLEVQYTCAPAIMLGRCETEISLPSERGYLSLPQYPISTRPCKWTLLVNKTQHVSVTLEPLTDKKDLLCPSSLQVAELQQTGRTINSRWNSITACPDGDSHYESKSPGVRISYTQPRDQNQQTQTLFLLHYKVNGCPQIIAPAGGWVTQNSSFAKVKCNLTAETWYLSCTGTEWNGSAGNCSHKAEVSNTPPATEFPLSIVMAIFLGLLLGIVVGVILLGLVYFYFWYRKKPNTNYQTPDVAGSYYGEDPSHKEMYGRSLDRQHSCDYSTNYPLHNTCPAHSGSAIYGKYTGIISTSDGTHTTLPHPEEMYLKRQHSDIVNT